MTEHWYAVMTHPQAEQTAADWLRRLEITVFYPYIMEMQAMSSSRTRMVKKPWLPRYLFVNTTEGRLGAVKEATGVSDLVYGASDEPLPIPNTVMKELMGQTNVMGMVKATDGLPRRGWLGRIGSKVTCKEGSPLWGFVGTVKKVLGNEAIIELQREFLGRPEVRLSVDQLIVEAR